MLLVKIQKIPRTRTWLTQEQEQEPLVVAWLVRTSHHSYTYIYLYFFNQLADASCLITSINFGASYNVDINIADYWFTYIRNSAS